MISFQDQFIRKALSIFAFPLSLFQLASSRYQSYQYKPIGQMVQLDQHLIHANVTGQGKPTIILESGMGGCSLDWCQVQSELAEMATVISYDRAGFGWSTPSPTSPTCQQYVDDLHLLLTKIDRKPPFLLVGHSYGGMIMRLFAVTYPEEVIGLVLVDSTHENRYLHNPNNQARRQQHKQYLKTIRLGYLLSPIAIPRLLKMHIGSKRLPIDMQKKVQALGYRTTAYKSAYSEYLHTKESSVQLEQAQPLRNDLPVIVLSAGKQPEDWKKSQEDLLHLTEITQHIIVEDSWHSIQNHRPDVVINSVKYLLNKIEQSSVH
ncbi:alpha/beta fold hydrolase [Paenibacillus crassostreae]|uniref:AB hydrolase-1 domain-containing protein n=1 Tax=Paenibacillus crassostreae TaxID=1763538 RepID=A0A167FH56_9BACL|nr:alpha/beta hydrolase [Paenibacillus crassostreae]AOZ94408.1 alpha/beta hydrolase [Paenibacillus crassostreae]OAB76555.1 hypothetical protein PNBC_03900 [Paenibacillus crassostreae]